jgi:hypothetical protein
MRFPKFLDLAQTQASLDSGSSFFNLSAFFGTHLHPNPLFYKYRYWVFTKDSPCEGNDFLYGPYSVCLAEYERLVGLLAARREVHWAYSGKFPRRDPANTPFDFSSPRWADVEWAPPFHEDTDPPVEIEGVLFR